MKIKKGDLIVKSKPFAYKLLSKWRGERCENCFKEGESLKRCAQCKMSFYCNKQCQIESWTVHKHECGKLIKLLQQHQGAPLGFDNKRIVEEFEDWAVLLFRIIRKLKNGGDKESETIGNVTRTFDSLVSHKDDLKRDMIRMVNIRSAISGLKFFTDDEIPLEEIIEIAGKVMVNYKSIMSDVEGVKLGTGLYLGASGINHSCRPNAYYVFDGPTLILINAEDQEELDLSKITVPYIKVLDVKMVRQKKLLEQYYFTCNCIWCKDDVIEKQMVSMCCANAKCSEPVYIHNEKCDKCGRAVEPSKRDEALEIMKELEEESSKAMMLFQGQIKLITDVTKKAARLLHPLNVAYVKGVDSAWDICQWTENHKRSLAYGLAALHGYRTYFNSLHPVFIIFLSSLGGLQRIMHQEKEGVSKIKEALHIVSTFYGEHHPATINIRQMHMIS